MGTYIAKRSVAGLVFMLTLAFFISGIFHAAESKPLSFKTSLRNDFARIFLYIDTPQAFDVALNNNTVTINFGESIEGEIGPLVQNLPDYISAVQLGANNRTLILTLNRANVGIRKFKGRNFVGFDILGGTPLQQEAQKEETPPQQEQQATTVQSTAPAAQPSPPAPQQQTTQVPPRRAPAAAPIAQSSLRIRPTAKPQLSTATVTPTAVAPSPPAPQAQGNIPAFLIEEARQDAVRTRATSPTPQQETVAATPPPPSPLQLTPAFKPESFPSAVAKAKGEKSPAQKTAQTDIIGPPAKKTAETDIVGPPAPKIVQTVKDKATPPKKASKPTQETAAIIGPPPPPSAKEKRARRMPPRPQTGIKLADLKRAEQKKRDEEKRKEEEELAAKKAAEEQAALEQQIEEEFLRQQRGETDKEEEELAAAIAAEEARKAAEKALEEAKKAPPEEEEKEEIVEQVPELISLRGVSSALLRIPVLKPSKLQLPKEYEKKLAELKKKEEEEKKRKKKRSLTPQKVKGQLDVLAESSKKSNRIIFDWKKDVAAAIFERGGRIWAVFDSPVPAVGLDVINNVSFVEKSEYIKHRHYTIIRIDQPKKEQGKHNIRVYKKDLAWVMDIENKRPAPLSNIVQVEARELPRPNVFLPFTNTGDPLRFVDPDVGDKLIIIPFYADGFGISPIRNYVDFNLLETHQGVAIQLTSDDTRIKMLRDGIQITHVDTLNILQVVDNGKAKMLAPKKRHKMAVFQDRSILPFETAAFKNVIPKEDLLPLKQKEIIYQEEVLDDDDEGTETSLEEENETEVQVNLKKARELDKKIPTIDNYRRKLTQQIITASIEERNQKRFELAKFFFANKFYPDALSVLERIREIDPTMANSNQVKMLHATTHLFMHHYIDAEKLFAELENEFSLKEGLQEISLLHWISNHLIRPKNKQRREEIEFYYLDNMEGFIADYPVEIRQWIGLVAGEYHLKNDNISYASQIVGRLGEEDRSDELKNRATNLQAAIMAKEGNTEGAIELYETVTEKVFDRYNRARAGLEIAKLRTKIGEITIPEAVKHLESLRHVWRGDDFELELLQLIGGLFMQNKNYLDGLRAWRTLLTQFPGTQESLYTAGNMKKIFIGLFDKGEAYNIEPMQALSLYFEFRELTPVGKKGDNIIRQLVNHFVRMDLLESAAALLTHQVRFRSTGEERVKLGMKLVQIYLDNKEPKRAIEALDFIAKTEVDYELELKQKYLRARALFDLRRFRQITKLLRGDFTKPAQDIRLDIFLDKKNWFGIIRILEDRFFEIRKDLEPLRQDKIDDLLLLALAYKTQERWDKLDEIKADFDERIGRGDEKIVFEFVTNNIPNVNHRHFDKTVQLHDIESFMNDFLYWPSRQWPNVMQTLESVVERIEFNDDDDPITNQEFNNIVQLAVSYVMQGDDNAIRKLKRLQSRFSGVIELDSRAFPVFTSLTGDPDLIPEESFSPPIPIKEIETWVQEHYNAIRKPDDIFATSAAAQGY